MIGIFVTNSKGIESTYTTPAAWSEIKLHQWIEFLPLIDKLPPILSSVFDAKDYTEYTKLSLIDKVACHNYMAEVISIFTGCSAAAIKTANVNQIELSFFSIWAIINNYEYRDNVGVFEHKKRLWYLPQKNMHGSTLVEFAEAAQFEKIAQDVNNNSNYALLDVIAILARPKYEVYSSRRLKERKAIFRDLSMDKVWDISFFLLKLNNIFSIDISIYSLRKAMQTQK